MRRFSRLSRMVSSSWCTLTSIFIMPSFVSPYHLGFSRVPSPRILSSARTLISSYHWGWGWCSKYTCNTPPSCYAPGNKKQMQRACVSDDPIVAFLKPCQVTGEQGKSTTIASGWPSIQTKTVTKKTTNIHRFCLFPCDSIPITIASLFA